MKCPKCGYNSFDYLDSCKKCGKDLVEFKQRFGIKSVLFPGAAGISAATPEEDDILAVETPELAAATAMGATAAAVDKGKGTADSAEADDFGFDFMGESSEEEDLSFDDLFEEAPETEDMEESLEAPKADSADEAQATADEDFAFDLPDEDEELEEDFGFDPESLTEEARSSEKPRGSGEGPADPFDLPESSPVVRAPEASQPVSLSSPDVAEVSATLREPVHSSDSSPASLSADEDSDFVFDPAEGESDAFAQIIADSPAEADEESGLAETLPGSIGGRFASFVYDAVILMLVGLSFIIAAEVSLSRETGPLPTLDTLIDLSVPYFLIFFTLTFGYFTLFHFLAGQTPGKMLTGLRVEATDGEPLSFSQSFLRSVGGLLQLIPFGLGYLLVVFSGDGRGWNDRLAGTRVVLVTEKSSLSHS